MGGDSGPKRIHAVINRLVDCLKLNPNDLKTHLNSDEQAKLRAVNTEPENMKLLKEYKSEGRILTDLNIQQAFMRSAMNSAKLHKGVITH